MSKLIQLKASRKERVAKMRDLANKDTLSEQEKKDWSALEAEVRNTDEAISRLEAVAREEAKLGDRDPVPTRGNPDGGTPVARGTRKVIPNPGFANVGEVLHTLVNEPGDSRLRSLRAEMSTVTGAKGGVMMPTDIDPTIREVLPQEGIFRAAGRATVVPAGDAPDADFVTVSAKQSGANNVHAGVAVKWIDEGGAKPETDTELREVKYSPKEVAAHIVVTDKLLRNWGAASEYLGNKLRRALLAAEDVAFLNGNGVGKPKGVLNLAALKKVNRATINTVTYADLVAMEAEILEASGQAAWLINPRVRPKLRLMEDTEGHLIWQENARVGGTPQLLGRDVIPNFRSPALGSLGDVVLIVFPDYTIKDGVGTIVSASDQVKYLENKTVIKAFRAVDGGSDLDAAIKQEDGQTYSPFVALDVPA